ncbi:MAG: YggT family protein [Pseudomonadota bacterium]
MGGMYLSNAGVFLVKTIFGLYLLAIMLRFLLQWAHADFYNPISQFVVKITNPLLKPLRRIIPGFFGLDFAAVVLMLVIKLIELSLVQGIVGGAWVFSGLLVVALAELLSLALDVFFFSILIQVILSWVNPGAYNPAVSLLHSLNEPLLRPARRIIPPIGGLDLSPLVVMVVLKLATMLLVQPLLDFGVRLLLGR